VPGGREFGLVRSAEWNGPGRPGFDAYDVVGTLKLLHALRDRRAAEGIDWLDEAVRVDDPGRVRLGLRQPHIDPRSLMAFKVLPARWLTAQNKAADDFDYARAPFGTGPYRLAGTKAPAGLVNELVFEANPTYGRRPGRLGQPFVREIRFVELPPAADPAAEFRANRLHILTDIPTRDIAKYEGPESDLKGKVQVVTAAQNRRIHMLAVNHFKPYLQSRNVRLGLSQAIDRERILSEVYRAGTTPYHRPLTGPFPPGCWATPPSAAGKPNALSDTTLAAATLNAYLGEKGSIATLQLAYNGGSRSKWKPCSAPGTTSRG
jgi:ABC-type oligopeptide transport system substrate-binding subunit